MCEISEKLKLCSCKTKDVEQLKHYWILQRPENRGEETLGLILPPADIGDDMEKLNIHTLQKQLNSGNCFDVTLDHQENDILQLHFTCKNDPDSFQFVFNHGEYMVYAFAYKKGKWKKAKHDPFGNNLYEVQSGRITSPFVRNPLLK